MINHRFKYSATQLDSYIPDLDFSKMKIGLQHLADATLDTSNAYYRANKTLADKDYIMKVIERGDIDGMREVSNFFFSLSGIYRNLCISMSTLYNYDWYVIPYFIEENKKDKKIVQEFKKILKYFDDSNIKNFCRSTTLTVIKNGAYYGYIIPTSERFSIQELPANYCRLAGVKVGDNQLIEFNLKFFESQFRDESLRQRVLEMFPPEFKKAYNLYKKGKLPLDSQGKNSAWYALDINNTVYFSMHNTSYPLFMSVIPAIVDLANAQELDRKRMQQQLLKLIIQKLPLDKNGEMIFDMSESKEIHNVAVQMLAKAIGIDVLTTFADTSVETLEDNRTATSTDELEKVERALFNEAGVSELLYNSNNSVSLEKSIIEDEGVMLDIIDQYQIFFNNITNINFNKKNKKFYFRYEFLKTTAYNYKDLAKIYKEGMQIGFSKLLPQIALGQSQSAILAMAYFENEILDLVSVFIPPISSNNMNTDMLKQKSSDSSDKTGRPTNEESGKATTEKTAANRESKGNGG